MARSVKGDVVVVPFPFSDLTQAKRLDGVERASVMRAIKEELDQSGILRDRSWPQRAWIQALLAELGEQ